MTESQHDAARRRKAVATLYRIRAVEAPHDEDGIKSVWHRTAEGADLLSFVDRGGRVTRQELTLLSDHFLWTAEQGLRTGQAGAERVGIRATDHEAGVRLDAANSLERLKRASSSLGAYDGSDRYLLHIARVLALAVRGMQALEAEEVTAAATLSAEDVARARKRVLEKKAPPTWMLALGGVAGALVLAALVYLAVI